MLKKATPNGACLTNAISIALFGNEEKSEEIRMQINEFLVKNFDNYEHLFQVPFKVFCGVGDARIEYLFQDKNALKSFLLSKNSVYMWNTDVDIPILCNI